MLVRDRFAESGIDMPQQEARVLVGGLLGLDLTGLVLAAGEPVAPADQARVMAAADRCCAGAPVHRVLGHRSFFGLELALSPAVLEPRPDTEILVDTVLPQAHRIAEREGRCRILDLGTGSGAIGLALADAVADALVVATDISSEALQVARGNAMRLGLSNRFHTIQSNWFSDVEGRFDLIVSNPPYIASSLIASLDRRVRDHDPRIALDGGPDGLTAYRIIAGRGDAYLEDAGQIAVEIGFDQQASVKTIFKNHGFVCRAANSDLGGRDRTLVFEAQR